MKRTKVINKSRFRKGFVLASVVASTFALSGCEVADQTVKMYQTVDECSTIEATEYQSAEQCKASFEAAKAEHEKSAPKFQGYNDCSAEFGNCNYDSGTGSFMPAMMGFMVGQMMGNMQANSNFRASQPMYNNPNGGYKDISGKSYSNIKPGKPFQVTRSAMSSKPASTVQARSTTSSRGGFGGSARSGSFGG